jgi:sodium/bile acid cotransporter 7
LKELSRLLPDSFTLAILGVVLLSLVLPCRGESAVWVANGSEIAIALLFFLQGARLSRATVVAGMLHWQLHLIILAATFVIFPLLGLALSPCRAAGAKALSIGAATIDELSTVPARR